MKTSREQLKLIVKELMVEILSEGLGAAVQRASVPGRASGVAVSEKKNRFAHNPALDTPISNKRVPSQALKEAIRQESGGNPIIADILADTAMTTLPAMLAHGDAATPQPGAAPAGPVQQEHFNGDPEEVFGVDANHWANLAFAESPKNKSS